MPTVSSTSATACAMVGALLGLVGACSDRAYACRDDAQCVANGQAGFCELGAGFCAYPDDACPSPKARYGPYAGSLSGRCVGAAEGSGASSGSTVSQGSSSGTGSDTGTDDGIPVPPIDGTTWYVATDGSDQGPGTEGEPFATLQHALAQAMPGDGISLADGEYLQSARTVRDAEQDAPIVIFGSAQAVLHGDAAADAVVEILHDHHVLHGLGIDGLTGSATDLERYRNHLVLARGAGPRHRLQGLRLLDLTLHGAAAECVRLQDFVGNSEIASCTITTCGVRDYGGLDGGGGGENGEGIFIGTPTSQWSGNTTDEPDACNDNVIRNNTIDTRGNECIDVQEGASGNLIERNSCTGQKDPDSGGINLRGSGNFVRDNEVVDCVGAGVRLGGFEVDGVQYGVDSEVTDNTLRENGAGGMKIQQLPQGPICGNVLEANVGGPSVGDFGDEFDPAAPCPQ